MAIKPFISSEQIDSRISAIAKEINRDYRDRELIILAVLKGPFIFCADLIRKLDVSLKVEFITLSSYQGKESSGKIIF